jgi:ribokinase
MEIAKTMRPIVVVGSINMDLVSAAPRISMAGETLFGSSFQMHSGGKDANQAVAVARLGYPAEMIGMVGSRPWKDPPELRDRHCRIQGAASGGPYGDASVA